MGRQISNEPIISRLYNPIASYDQFGSGKIQAFLQDGTFVMPEDISTIRVRLWGAGGGEGVTGGTSSFGAHCSATGGVGPTTSATSPGGSGVGGDVNYTGGSSTYNSNNYYIGGGGAASFFGNGAGASISVSNALGAGAGGSAIVGNTGQAGSNGFTGKGGSGGATGGQGGQNGTNEGLGFGLNYLDFIATGGGGGGGYSSTTGGSGSNGGGGGGYNSSGGFPGGGSGTYSYFVGGGGGGFTLKTITGLTPGTTIAVTVGQSGGTQNAVGGNGLVIVEY